MKLGCSSSSYHATFRSGSIDLQRWIRVCADDLAVDGVEFVDQHFPSTDPSYLREIKKLCVDSHLTIAGIAVNNDFGADERRAQEIETVQQWCDVAAYLGAPVVRVFGGSVPAPDIDEDPGKIVGAFRKVFGAAHASPRRTWSDATYALRVCADYAAERGIVLALQNSPRAGFISSATELVRCVGDVGSPWLRICLEPAGLSGTNITPALEQTVQIHAHLQDVGDDGSDRRVDWPELLGRLYGARYRGFVLIDYDGAGSPDTTVPVIARYLRGALLHAAQAQPARSIGPAPTAAEQNGAAAVAEHPAPQTAS